MSQLYTIRIQQKEEELQRQAEEERRRQAEEERRRRAEEERQRRAEEERQRRIEAERAQVAQIVQQRELLQAKHKAIRDKLEASGSQASILRPDMSRDDSVSSLDQILRQFEEQLERLNAYLANQEARLKIIEGMNPDIYHLFTTLESTLAESHNMALTAIRQAEDGSWQALFNRLENSSQVVKVHVEQSTEDTLNIDVTEGFIGDDCDVFMEQVKTASEARGITLDYTPLGYSKRTERGLERDSKPRNTIIQNKRVRN